MWAVRRASSSLRFRIVRVESFRPCCLQFDSLITKKVEESSPFVYFAHSEPATCTVFNTNTFHCFSSQAGAKSGCDTSEDDSGDGFSELESRLGSEEGNAGDGNEDELASEPELDQEDEKFDLLDAEGGSTEGRSKKEVVAELFQAIYDVPSTNVRIALDKWVEGGKKLGRAEVSMVMLKLRKRKMFGKALQLSEWLEASKRIDFLEQDYASRLDLIAKVRGLQKAEQYVNQIPESFRGEVIYRTLLAFCVSASNLKKAEALFKKMRDLKFPISPFACNQMLILYKRLEKKKIADVLLLMEKENVKPTAFTYKILMDTKGQSNDIMGMDQILETMKAEGIEPDLDTQAILAKHYVAGGFKEKAEAILKEMEGENLKEHRWACRSLLPLYAELGAADEVGRIWKFCESNPRLEECMAAIEAFGKLHKIDEAEVVFDKMSTTWKRLSSKHYATLLKVYANHKMLTKGKDLVKRMADGGFRIGPLTLDALVKLYVEAGEVEKADSMLQKAVQQNQIRPMFNSYMAIMDQYSTRGDIHNAEKMFHRMRQSGYVARLRQFQALIKTYINAKRPAYGIRERMKADNIFPTKALASQLAQVDAFRKTAVSDLLD